MGNRANRNRIYTTAQAAGILGLTVRRLNQLIDAGDVAATKYGPRCTLIDGSEVVRVLRERRAKRRKQETA